MKVLYSSQEVLREVKRLFSDKSRRRVAIAAFVGEGAEAYLPHPAGLHLVCWPQAGSTNPKTLRKLHRAGAQIEFVDRLHMKVYWAQRRGAVVTSANLSTNAFGSGDLKECGVFLKAGVVNIDRLLRSLPRRSFDKGISKLEAQQKAVLKKSGPRFQAPTARTFRDWFDGRPRKAWRIWTWAETVSFSLDAIAKARNEFGSKPYDSIICKKGLFRAGDWILSVRDRGGHPSSFCWSTVDFVTQISRKPRSKDEDRFEAVQVWPPKRYALPPFDLDARFKRAFRKAVQQLYKDNLDNVPSIQPRQAFLAALYRYY